VDNTTVVANLNADMVDGMHANEFVFRNGTTPLTGHWNAGPYGISALNLSATTLTTGGVVFAGTNGILTTQSQFTYDSSLGRLDVPSIGPFTLNGTITGNDSMITGIKLASSTIVTTSMTLSQGNVFDASAGTVVFRTGQISGNWLAGGTGAINISGNAGTVTNGVYSTLFGANTIIKADTQGSPVALVVPESTLVGRISNGVIDALTPAKVRNLLNVAERGAETAYVSGAILRSGHLEYADGGTMSGLFFFSTERILLQANQAASVLSPDKQITYISVTYGAGTNIATVILPDGIADGQMRWIIVSSLVQGVRLLVRCTLTPTNATGPAITGLIARKSGQSAQLIWDNSAKAWFIAPSGMQIATI
jgi:hypothetical protein